MKVTEEMRREVIAATGLCLHPECTAHDRIVGRIWRYKEEAYERGFGTALIESPLSELLEAE